MKYFDEIIQADTIQEAEKKARDIILNYDLFDIIESEKEKYLRLEYTFIVNNKAYNLHYNYGADYYKIEVC